MNIAATLHEALLFAVAGGLLALPEDMLAANAAVDDAVRVEPTIVYPGPEAITELRTRLGQARRPLVLVGGSGWSERACAGFGTLSSV